MAEAIKTLTVGKYRELLSDLKSIWDSGKVKAKRAVTRQLLQTYWEIGGRISDEKLTSNAGYAKTIMERLARDIRTDMTTLYRCIQFNETYKSIPESDHLAWAHYRVLLALKDSKERDYYAALAEQKEWTRDQLLKAVQGDVYETKILDNKKGVKLERPTDILYVYKAIVQEIVDGDTLVLDVDCGFTIKKQERIRLRGVDCPELITEEGQEAADWVLNRLANVPFVMVRTTKVDINGRFLGDVFYSLDDEMEKQDIYREGRYLNQELLDRGLAVAYVS